MFNLLLGGGSCYSKLIIGEIYSRYGIYGHLSLNSEVPTDLDTCGGHTHLINGEMTYHYHFQDSFPWTIGCFRGCPDITNSRQQLRFTRGEQYGCPAPEGTTPRTTPTNTTDSDMEATSATGDRVVGVTDDVGVGTNEGVRVVCELSAVLLCVLVGLLQ